MAQENRIAEIPALASPDAAALLRPGLRRYLRVALLAAGALLVVVAIAVYYVGFVAPYESTDDAFIDGYVTLVSPRVPGQVEALWVRDNERVRRGQLLLEIDPREYEAHLARARADTSTLQGQEKQAQALVRIDEARVVQARAGVAAADARAQQADADLSRYRSVSRRAVSRSAFDLVLSQALAAKADARAARSQLSSAEAQVTLAHAGVDTAASAVERAEAALREAQLNLSYTKVRAPRAGRVTARTVELGEYVEPGQSLLALVPKRLWVVANFKETQLTHMRPGQPAELSMDAYPDQTFKGRVDSLQAGTGARFSLLPPENAVGNYVKVVQRVPVKIVFDQPLPSGLDIAPGMSVEPTVRVK
jgi:membrane fusion protein, multidrug efflux system